MNTRTLFEHPICRVEGFDVPSRSGPQTFMRLCVADWVNVVAVDQAQRIVLIRQHRWGIDAETLEIPGGVVDPGEAPLQAAQRELREETGYTGGVWSELGWLHPNPAIQDNRVWTFLAQGVALTHAQEPDPTEDIAVELRSWAQVRDDLLQQRISHALVAAALQRYALTHPSP